MALRLKQVTIPLQDGNPDSLLLDQIAATLQIQRGEIQGFRIQKKSLDARRKGRPVYHYHVHVDVLDEERIVASNRDIAELADEPQTAQPVAGLDLDGRESRTRPIIIGAGPAGTFAALVLVMGGQKPIIVERGEPVEARFKTVGRLRRDGSFSAESNYCFGEGGAGTFSDGKLTCGRNHPLIRFLFDQWVKFGAPEEILYDAHPHIGTDYLMSVALRMRRHLEEHGATFMFNRRLVDLETQSTGARLKVSLDRGESLETDQLVLSIGHSARDTYQMLYDRGLAMQPKPFAVGARFEHPQEVINKIQYGSCSIAPPAEYKLASQEGDRGIWTFCMCPGGHLLPTSAQEGHLAINGMSYHARNSGFANAAVVVNVRREDFFEGHVLDGVRFQERIEQAAFRMGGGEYRAPAQRITDFIAGRESKGELRSTYKPGIVAGRLDKLLPPFITESLQSALFNYEKRMRGFIHEGGLVAGVESKTSSPIVMMRDKNLQSISHPGLFPTGEGAGFAGGIVSASLDGVRVGRALLEDLCATAVINR